jgi:hypothetical protein
LKILLLGMLVAMSSCAGMKDDHPENISIEKEFITKKSQLHNHGTVNDWIALNFNNSSEVIKVNDKERGRIVLKGLKDCEITNGMAKVRVTFHLNMTVTSTDQKVVINIPNIVSTDGWDYPRTDEQMDEVKKCIEEEIISPISSDLMK